MVTARPPDLRVAYDLGGVAVQWYRASNNTLTPLNAAQKVALNDPINTNVIVAPNNSTWNYVIWLFPQPMTISGLWATIGQQNVIIGSATAYTPWGYSTDTTDGLDGTWTYLGGVESVNISTASWAEHGVQNSTATEPEMWTQVHTLTPPLENIRGLKLGARGGNTRDAYIRSAAIYGRPTDPQWLEFWHPLDDQPITLNDLDWGFHGKLTQAVRTFRLKNCNPTYTLKGISLSLSDISGDSPKAGDNHRLSLDGVLYDTSVEVGDIGPGDISGTLYVRRNTPSDAIEGPNSIYEVRIVPKVTGLA